MPEAKVVVSSSKSGDDPLFSTRLVLQTASVAKSEIYQHRNMEETLMFGTPALERATVAPIMHLIHKLRVWLRSLRRILIFLYEHV